MYTTHVWKSKAFLPSFSRGSCTPLYRITWKCLSSTTQSKHHVEIYPGPRDCPSTQLWSWARGSQSWCAFPVGPYHVFCNKVSQRVAQGIFAVESLRELLKIRSLGFHHICRQNPRVFIHSLHSFLSTPSNVLILNPEPVQSQPPLQLRWLRFASDRVSHQASVKWFGAGP